MEASFARGLSWGVSSMSSAETLEQLQKVGASDQQARTIGEKFQLIQKCVEEVGSRSVEGHPLELNRWLKDVNDLIFYVEDTINEYKSEDEHKKNQSFKGTSLFLLPIRMSYRVRKILSSLNKLLKKSSTLGLTRLEVSPDDEVHDSPLYEFVFERNFKKIIECLTKSKASNLGILTSAIVGMPGIGKSTLAKRICDDKKIIDHFGMIFWVEVGKTFDATKIQEYMFKSLSEDNLQSVPEELRENKKNTLRYIMRGKTSLIVLDDVTSVNEKELQELFTLQSGGGTIHFLATVRRIDVARSLGDPIIHHVKRLTLDESWALFKSVASSVTQTPIEELEPTGSKIVGKCYGIPRVISKMAASLENVANVREWEEMAETELWEIILSALKFHDLPTPLRQCFAYCSIFPKRTPIEKRDLMSLWIAQGFLTEEATAEDYLNILLNNSLLQVRREEDDNVLEYELQGLAYDLAVNISRHDHLIAYKSNDIKPGSLSEVRHLVISTAQIVSDPSSRQRCRLRTIYVMSQQVQENLLSQARSLYVLKLDNIGLEEVPRDLDKLKYLRYLDLSNNQIRCLPESITQLNLLQTLRLINCVILSPLSEGLSNFINNLPNPPKLFSKLGTSKQLDPVYLNAEEASKQLSNLGRHADTAGVLCISGLEYVKFKEAAEEARISSKSKLSSLELCWNRSEQLLERAGSADDEKVLDGLQPHPNIRRLKLINYDSQQFPEWVMRPMKGDDNERLSNLVRIALVNCKRCQSLPSMGELQCLQELIIDGMSNVENIGQELYYHAGDHEKKDFREVFFPALKRLELRNLDKLRNWETNNMLRAYTRLDTLQIVNCPNLTSTPTDFRIKELLIQGVEVNVKEHSWLDTIIKNSSSSDGRLTSVILSKVSGPTCLPRELFLCTTLRQLRLQKCESLNSWPGNPWNTTSLEELCIDRCSSLTYSPTSKSLTALKTLVIRGCRNLRIAPTHLNKYKSLTKLAITNCSDLKRIKDLRHLSFLEDLDIIDCEKIESLPQGIDSLTRLQTMRIGGEIIDKYKFFPECKSLKSLNTLWLKGMGFMVSLPQQIRHLSQLKVLRLWSFTSLKILPDWLCDLINLEILIFEECNFVSHLPPREKLMKLTKLRCLRIEKCQILNRSYNKVGGSKWRDISHIPHIKFDHLWFQGDRSSILEENPINTQVVEQRDSQPANNHKECEDCNDEEHMKDGPSNDYDAGTTIFLGFCLLHYFVIIILLAYWVMPAIFKE